MEEIHQYLITDIEHQQKVLEVWDSIYFDHIVHPEENMLEVRMKAEFSIIVNF